MSASIFLQDTVVDVIFLTKYFLSFVLLHTFTQSTNIVTITFKDSKCLSMNFHYRSNLSQIFHIKMPCHSLLSVTSSILVQILQQFFWEWLRSVIHLQLWQRFQSSCLLVPLFCTILYIQHISIGPNERCSPRKKTDWVMWHTIPLSKKCSPVWSLSQYITEFHNSKCRIG